jgi:hypothetical protein
VANSLVAASTMASLALSDALNASTSVDAQRYLQSITKKSKSTLDSTVPGCRCHSLNKYTFLKFNGSYFLICFNCITRAVWFECAVVIEPFFSPVAGTDVALNL